MPREGVTTLIEPSAALRGAFVCPGDTGRFAGTEFAVRFFRGPGDIITPTADGVGVIGGGTAEGAGRLRFVGEGVAGILKPSVSCDAAS